jgi:hypothetical protein
LPAVWPAFAVQKFHRNSFYSPARATIAAIAIPAMVAKPVSKLGRTLRDGKLGAGGRL